MPLPQPPVWDNIYMKIDGKQIANSLFDHQKKIVEKLSRFHSIPRLSVILIGNDPSSQTYIRQKKLYGASLGIRVDVQTFPVVTPILEFYAYIESLNVNPDIAGVIIQRPLPFPIPKDKLDSLVVAEKDVDGFHPQTKFIPPVAMTVLKILEEIQMDPFSKKILIIGRGESGGGPIAQTLAKMHIPCTVAHSKTENIEKICRGSDIIISCVGKPNIVRRDMVSNRTILLGVGLHAEHGKLKPDYDEEEIKDVVKYYTPVPGGVGPVNVACLFENVLKAASNQR